MSTITQARMGIRSEARLAPALFAFTLGAFLVFTMGFAHPELLHNSGHDWRHSMNFPCH